MKRWLLALSVSAVGVFLAAQLRAQEQAPYPWKIGVCTGVGQGALLASNGFDYIEQSVTGFLSPDQPEEAFQKRLDEARRKSPLPIYSCNGFLGGGLRVTGPEANHDRIVAYAGTAFRRARAAGIQLIVFGSGGARRIPEGFAVEAAQQQFVDLLKRIGPAAASNGVTLAIEPLCKKECNFVNSVEEAFAIAERVNHPAVQVLADTYHMGQDGEPVDHIVKYASRLRHVHVADPRSRAQPTGECKERIQPYLDALRQIGYKGGVSIESKGGEKMADWAGEAAAFLKGKPRG